MLVEYRSDETVFAPHCTLQWTDSAAVVHGRGHQPSGSAKKWRVAFTDAREWLAFGMDRPRLKATEVVCRVGYTGSVSVYVEDEGHRVVQPRTIKIFLERKDIEPLAPLELTGRKGVGKIIYGIYRPLGFPAAVVPYDLHQDIIAPLRRVWSQDAHQPADWLHERFPNLKPEFLVFGSVEIDERVSGRRIALAVMVDLINRHLPPGGIALLNPYPLEYLFIGHKAGTSATPEEKQRGVAALKRHYSRIGLEAVESEPDLMVLRRPPTPLRAPRCDLRLPRDTFRGMPDVSTYEGLY